MARIAGITREQSESKILNAAVACIAQLGDKETTFRTIAERAGVSPALVGLYFGSRDKVFSVVLEHVVQLARKDTVRAIEQAAEPIDKMKAYFRVSIEFFRTTPDWAKIYLHLYHLAAIDPKQKEICTEIKQTATKRIETILEAGQKAGQFQVTDRALTARTIHDGLLGLLLSIMTTQQAYSDSVLIQQFERMVLQAITPPRKRRSP